MNCASCSTQIDQQLTDRLCQTEGHLEETKEMDVLKRQGEDVEYQIRQIEESLASLNKRLDKIVK